MSAAGHHPPSPWQKMTVARTLCTFPSPALDAHAAWYMHAQNTVAGCSRVLFPLGCPLQPPPPEIEEGDVKARQTIQMPPPLMHLREGKMADRKTAAACGQGTLLLACSSCANNVGQGSQDKTNSHLRRVVTLKRASHSVHNFGVRHNCESAASSCDVRLLPFA